MPLDAALERPPDAAVECRRLALVEAPSLAQRVHARIPERLIGVDVPDAGECALVEDRRLHRGAAVLEPRPETCGGERAAERFGTDAFREIRLLFPTLEQRPRAEAADVTIGNVRPVV